MFLLTEGLVFDDPVAKVVRAFPESDNDLMVFQQGMHRLGISRSWQSAFCERLSDPLCREFGNSVLADLYVCFRAPGNATIEAVVWAVLMRHNVSPPEREEVAEPVAC